MAQFFSGDTDSSLVTIDVSRRLRRLNAHLMDRLETRKKNGLRAYPTLDEKLAEPSVPHIVNKNIADQIKAFVAYDLR
jgi:hypothetical protein